MLEAADIKHISRSRTGLAIAPKHGAARDRILRMAGTVQGLLDAVSVKGAEVLYTYEVPDVPDYKREEMRRRRGRRLALPRLKSGAERLAGSLDALHGTSPSWSESTTSASSRPQCASERRQTDGGSANATLVRPPATLSELWEGDP